MLQNIFPRLLLALCLAVAGHVHAAALTDNDLMDCSVLTGKKKKQQYNAFITQLTQAASKGDINSNLNLAGILNNRFVCLEEEQLGDQPWTVVIEQPGSHEVETTHRPVLKNLKQYPAVYAALLDAIAAYQRISESNLNARMALGNYYAEYHDTLNKNVDGYFYLASVYEAECNSTAQDRAKSKQRCMLLKQDKMLYLPLLDATQRALLDQKAKDWAAKYLAKTVAQ